MKGTRSRSEPETALPVVELVGDDGGMTDREAFIEAIAAEPADDTPRLAFADWLDEHGEPARAEFVRLCCRFARMDPNGPDAGPTQERVKDLFGRHWQEWLGPVCGAFGQHLPRFRERRGFLGRILRIGRRSDSLDQYRRPQFFGEVILVPLDIDGSSTAPPLRHATIHGGLFASLTVGSSDAASAGLRDAFRIEPVTGLDLELADTGRDWDRVAGPHLRRVLRFHPTFAGDAPAPPAALVARILDSDDLAGVTDLTLSGPVGLNTVWNTVPASWVGVLARSEMGPRLEELRVCASADAAAELAGLPADARLHSLDIQGPTTTAPNPGIGSAVAGLPFRNRLSHLGMTFQQDGTDSLQAVSAAGPWARLESLSWTATYVDDRAAEALANSDGFPALERLDLAVNDLTDRGAVALARAGFVCRLRSLSLGHQQITDVGAAALAEVLAGGPIEHLTLTGNPLTDKGRRRVAHILGPKVLVSL